MQNIFLEETEKNQLLSPKLDVIFQALFGEVGSENITKRFLEAILNKKIKSIDLSQNPIIRREHIDDKLGVLDVIAKIDNNENCNIEMQMTSQKNIVERLLHYWSGTYSKQLKAGNNYNKLQKTISILIANFNLPGLDNLPFQTTWKIIEEEYRKTILTEYLEIRINLLTKVNIFFKNFKKYCNIFSDTTNSTQILSA